MDNMRREDNTTMMKKGVQKTIGKRIVSFLLAFILIFTSGMLDCVQIQASTEDIFTGTGITLDSTVLKASWPDGTGGSNTIELTVGSEVEFPYNATIDMRLNFTIPTGTSLVVGQEYVYTVPGNIRVDEEVTHDLLDPDGITSIGTVHISKSGTLTFKFNDNAKGSASPIPYYVQFSGGLSSDLQEEGKNATIQFPTSTGTIDYPVKTDPKAYGKPQEMSKSGTVVTIDGQKYIEWRVNIEPDSSGVVSGEIVDHLPAGLKYAAESGYPQFADIIEGQGETLQANCADGASDVSIRVSGAKAYYRVGVKFLTTCGEFTGVINNSTSAITYDNTAAFNPDDGTGVSSSCNVTIWPHMLEKSGSTIDSDGNITWTIILNEDGMDLNEAVLEDVIDSESGLELVLDSVEVSPKLSSAGTLVKNNSDFKISFSGSDKNTYTITYKTKVTDFTKSNYSNTVTLKDPNTSKFDLSKTATVNGINVIRKQSVAFNTITNTFTWKIIVNEAERSFDNIQVKDWFSSERMEFVSATLDDNTLLEPVISTCEDTIGGNGNQPCTELTFNLGKQNTKREITIVTKIKDSFYAEAQASGQEFKNYASFSDTVLAEVKTEATEWKQITTPQLIKKQGSFNENTGLYTWTVNFEEQTLPMTQLSFEDLIPEGMEYVDGTMEFYAWSGSHPWTRYSITPTKTVSGTQEKLTYTFDKTKADEEYLFAGKGFSLEYSTKISDVTKTNDGLSYINSATVKATFDEGTGIEVTDTKSATVTGKPGGVVGKTGIYNNTDDFVTWIVDINAAHYDMSDIANPAITDQLADYFKYIGGKLYVIDDTKYSSDSGYRTEVQVSDYTVAVVNNKITVILPASMGTNHYQFEFKTQFTVTAAELSGKKITNTANFVGSGEKFEKTSNEITNASFSSSSAGTIINRELRILKEDSVTHAPLSGAEFDLYLNGILVGSAVSDSNGYATFKDIDSLIGYELKLRETKAPSGYTADSSDRTIPAFTADEMLIEGDRTRYYLVTVPNVSESTSTTGDIILEKKDSTGTKLLKGAVFGLYPETDLSCAGAPITTQTSGADGKISFKNKNIGTYYIKEITSPDGYVLDSATITKVELKDEGGVIKAFYNGSSSAASLFTLTNTSAKGSLVITKADYENEATVLSDAKFELYDDPVCTNRIDSQTTDSAGAATFSNLELGKTYYYREVQAPSGYVLDGTIHTITIGTGAEKADQTEAVTLKNKKAVGNIVVKKVDDSITPQKLSGVSFTLYESGNATPYQKDAADYVVVTNSEGIAVFQELPFGDYVIKETTGKEGYQVSVDTNVTVDSLGNKSVTIVNKVIQCRIEITKQDGSSQPLAGAEFSLIDSVGMVVKKGTTNDSGKLAFENVVYGDYTLRETKAPEGYNKAADITINKSDINNAFNGTGVITKTIIDEKQNGSIKVKKNDEIGTTPLQGATFTLFDSNMIEVASDVSGTNGEITFTGLKYGTYYVQETAAPTDYILDTTTYKVIVSSDTVVTAYDNGSGSEPLVFSNNKVAHPIVSVKLKKVDSADKTKPVANAIYGLFRNSETTPIAQAVSDAYGMVVFRRVDLSDALTPGIVTDTNTFTIKEITAPTGYKLSTTEYSLGTYSDIKNGVYMDNGGTAKTDGEIAWYQNQEADATVTDEAIKGSVEITKRSSVDNALLAGAKFELLKEDKTSFLPAKFATTDSTGKASFTDLPVGYYYLKEVVAPDGFSVNAADVKVSILDETPVEKTIKDVPLELKISKKAVGGTTELAGAQLELKEQATQTVVYTATTTGSILSVPNNLLKAETTYILTEKKPPTGYGYAGDITFTIKSDGSIDTTSEKSGQTIIMRDQPIYTTISKVDNSGTPVFVPNATLAVYDSVNHEVLRFVTGTGAYTTPVGKLVAPASEDYATYTLKEIITPAGYETAPDYKFRVYKNGSVCADTAPYSAITGITMVDYKKTDTKFYIRKINAETGMDLAGASLCVTAVDNDHKVVWTSDGSTHAIEIDKTNFKKDGSSEYLLQEVSAPGGYALAGPIRFKLETDGKVTIISGGNASNINGDKDTLLVRDQKIDIKLRKENSFGLLLPGAELRLCEYDYATQTVGRHLDTYTSTDTACVIDTSKLYASGDGGKWYILQESVVPAGYLKAENFIFKINANGQVQKADGTIVPNNIIVMEDKQAGVCIGKTDAQTNEPVAGATLKITSDDDATFVPVEWVSDGTLKAFEMSEFNLGRTYTLTETHAPDGYGYAEPIDFTIDNATHEVLIHAQPVADRTFTMADKEIVLSVQKLDANTNEPLEGAQLCILDSADTELVNFTSGQNPVKIDSSILCAPAESGYREYTLREKSAPHGYHVAVDVLFAVDHAGNIYSVTVSGDVKQYNLLSDGLVTMYDEPVLTVSKMDIAGNYVAGAELLISAKDDESFKPVAFTTTKEAYVVNESLLSVGKTYILSEQKAPDGYLYAKDIEFSINADHKLVVGKDVIENMRLVMLDTPIKITSKKTDGAGQLLAGAELAIKDSNGTVIYSYTTTAEPTMLPGDIFKAPKGDEKVYYTLAETKAPEGYELAKDITFAIDKDGNLYVKNKNGVDELVEDGILVMVDVASITMTTPKEDNTTTTTTTTLKKTKIPKTGDGTPLGTLMLFFWATLVGTVMSFVKYFRQRSRRKKKLKEKGIVS